MKTTILDPDSLISGGSNTSCLVSLHGTLIWAAFNCLLGNSLPDILGMMESFHCRPTHWKLRVAVLWKWRRRRRQGACNPCSRSREQRTSHFAAVRATDRGSSKKMQVNIHRLHSYGETTMTLLPRSSSTKCCQTDHLRRVFAFGDS